MTAAAKTLRSVATIAAATATRRLDFHRLRLSSCSCRAFFASSSSSLNATQNNDQSPSPSPPPTKTAPLLPIGVFIDLDNVAPKTHSRKDAQQFIFPLLQLGRLINQKRLLSPSFNESMLSHAKSPISEMKAVQKANAIQFEAFGNLATRSYVSEEQKEITSFDQGYIPWIPDDELEYGGYAQSGYDPNFDTVRCGICGWKAKLTKKKRLKYKNRGYTDEYKMLEEELMSHMKSLHDNEQKKRIARMGQNTKKGSKKKRGLKGKELMRYNKYQAAQVGLQRGKMQVSANGKVKIKRRNDLFQVLREIGVRVKSSVNVDADLIASAEKWLSRIVYEHHNNKDVAVVDDNNNKEDKDDGGGNRGDNNDDDDEQQQQLMKKESSSSHPDPIGVLVIYSRDQGFVSLIEHAKRNRFITVSVTNKRTQTSSLIRSSDIIVGQGLFGNWMNESANGISDDYDEDDGDDEYVTVDSNDEIDDELDEIERLFRDSDDDDVGLEEGGTSFDDLSEESMLDDNDWEERMFDESGLEEEGSADGHHEHDYEIRKLGNAPSWDSLKSLSSSKDNSVHAMSSSDVGLNFMISVQGVQNNDVEGITRWHLADDSVHKNTVKDKDTSMEMKPTTLKQLRREIMPWDSVYSSRGGDRLTEKKDESNQEDVNQEEKTSKKQKKRQKKATKKTKPVTEDEIAAAELKRALKIERKQAKKLTKKERKEAAAERRKVEAPQLAAKIARLEGFINNATAKDAKLEDFVYKGTSSNVEVKRMRLKLKNLEAAAKQKERKMRELTE